MHHSTGAHGARFNCNKESAVSQTVITNGCSSLAKCDHFGVSSGIAIGDVAVPATADDVSVTHNDSAYGNFMDFQCALGAAEGLFHPELVEMAVHGVVGRWLLIVRHAL